MSERPGVMLWFDTRAALELLSDEDRGKLLMGIIDYAQYGIVPDFSANQILSVAWGFIKPKIDLDGERYQDKCKNNKYNVFRRDYKSANPDSEIPSIEEWESKYGQLSYKQYISKSNDLQNTQPAPNSSIGAVSSAYNSLQGDGADYTKQTDAQFEERRNAALNQFAASRQQGR